MSLIKLFLYERLTTKSTIVEINNIKKKTQIFILNLDKGLGIDYKFKIPFISLID